MVPHPHGQRRTLPEGFGCVVTLTHSSSMRRFFLTLLLSTASLVASAANAEPSLLISEFLTLNVGGLVDQDGDSSDWIEIYNYGTQGVNLGGWHLTDDAGYLPKWTFPATNIAPQQFLVVFASGKNRAVAGAELHASFQLNTAGSYLGLVRPDGVTVESDYAPMFPPQTENVSYGLVPVFKSVPLVVEGKAAAWWIPTVASDLPSDWVNPGFDDTAWRAGVVPLGFDAGHVVGDLGGARTNLARGRSAIQSSTLSPYTAGLGVDGNLTNFTHTLPGQKLPATWEVNLATNTLIDEVVVFNRGDGCCGSRLRDITIWILSQDGKTTNYVSPLLNPENVLGGGGLAGPPSLTLNLSSVNGAPVLGGRVRVTRTPDPDLSGSGGQGDANEADVLAMAEVVVSPYVPPPTFRSMVQTDVQSQMLGVGASALVRIPFLVVLENLPTLESLTLRMKYDDGFVAYLNGVKIAEANAPSLLAWDSAAVREHPDPAAIQFEDFDVTSRTNLLQEGINVLAIQGLNLSASDDDFLLSPQLVGRTPTVFVPNYFSQPTPGGTNQPGTIGLVADTKFSVDRGFFDTPFDVTITTATEGAQIRYTTNGSAPSAVTGIPYTGPIHIDHTTVLRAVAVKPNYTPSDVDTQTYLFLDQVVAQSAKSATGSGFPAAWGSGLADYAMDPRITTNALNSPKIVPALRSLRTVCLTTSVSNLFDSAKGIYANPLSSGVAWERLASMEMIDTNGASEFQHNCGLRIQGGYFRDPGVTRKHSFRVLFKSEYGTSRLRHDLFRSDDAVAEFDTLVLRAGANDGYAWADAKDTEQFIRNRFGGDLDRELGNVSTHGIFVHLYLDGLYWGVYELCERPNEDFSASYFGGDSANWDSNNAGDIKNGDLAAWNAFNGILTKGTSVADYEKVQGNAPDGTRSPDYPVYLDKVNYIDYMIANMWGGNWDWPNKNFWFGRERTNTSTGFKFYMWDFENTMGNNRDRSPVTMVSPRPEIESSWVAQPHFYMKNIAEYRMDFADRIQRHFFNGGALTPAVLMQRYQKLADGIELAILCETARWGDDNLNPPQTIDAWRRERDWILGTYLPQRSDIVLKQFRAAGLYPTLAPPAFSQMGGTVLPGFTLTLSHTNATGDIYFTANGSDPRMIGGGISPSAQLYAGPLPISGNTLIRARVKSGTGWSPLVEAPFTTAAYFGGLVISEIMYNPVGTSTQVGDEFEFLELQNTGTTSLDLGGLAFVSGISFTFTNGTVLTPGGFFLLARNPAAFSSRYPGTLVNGVYTGSLANGGERLTLSHELLGTILSFVYGDTAPWPLTADGLGFSLVLRHPGSGENPDRPSSWKASAAVGGSPGGAEPAGSIPAVVINEVMSHGGAGQDAVELHNATPFDVPVGGWFLTDSTALLKRYRIPGGAVIPAGGFLVLGEAQFNPAGSPAAFSLSSSGDEVYLFSADSAGNLTGYSHGFKFGAAAEGVTFGRHLVSTGDEDFAAQRATTLGATNSGPRISPVVISEIQYHPAPDDIPFVEIHNASGTPVPLFDVLYPTNSWRLKGAGFVFPSGVVLAGGQFALIVGSAPEAFRARYGVDPSVPVFGPYSGSLQNSGELLELQRPAPPDTNKVDFITLDFVRYNDRGGWPAASDGGGPSLQRLEDSAYGNDPVNWVAGRATPGRSWAGGVRPTLTTQPRSAVLIVGGTTNLEVAAVSDQPIQYQWRFNGSPIPGAVSPLLALTNVQTAQSGYYSVVAFGEGGAVVSSNALLSVLVPARIVSQPVSLFALLGSNASLTISAISTTPLTYQWRFNGAEIPGANLPTLLIKGVGPQNIGTYTCVVADGVGPVESQPATLTIVTKAVVIEPPIPLEVVQGGVATFSVVGDGTLPLTYRWRKNGAVVTNMILDRKIGLYTLTNVQPANAGRYSVVLTNVAGAASATTDVLLTVLPDSDGDGIPDDWETRFGLKPNDPTDALLDPDGDLVSNRAEYLAGTDPGDRSSFLKVEGISADGAGVALEFLAAAKHTYSILYREGPSDLTWKVLANVPARVTNRLERVVDPAVQVSERLYRLGTPATQVP